MPPKTLSKNTSSQETQTNPLEIDELLLHILNFLSPEDLLRAAKVSHRWRRVAYTAAEAKIFPIPSQLSLGLSHTGIMTSNDQLFMWGNNELGQLGLEGHQLQLIPTAIPLTLPQDEYVRQFIASGHHNAILTSRGKLYMWGSNDNGQLGLGHKRNQHTPIIATLPLNNGERIQQIALGGSHSIALTSNRRVFAWGWNNSGQLGVGNQHESPTPLELHFQLATNEHIHEIASGENHAAALTNEGRVFMWGNNTFGQLGLASASLVLMPKPISLSLHPNERVTKIILGGKNSAYLTTENRFFAWGCNANGQLGLGHNNQQHNPAEVSLRLNPGEVIKDVSLGNTQSSIMTSNGRVFACAFSFVFDDEGRVTVEMRNGYQELHFPLLQQDEFIVTAAIGLADNHSGVLTSKNRLLMWGHNSTGELGSGDTEGLTLDTAAIIDLNEFFQKTKGISVATLGKEIPYGTGEQKKRPHLATLYYYASKNTSKLRILSSVFAPNEINDNPEARASSSSQPNF